MRKMSKAAKAEAYDGLANRLAMVESVAARMIRGESPDALADGYDETTDGCEAVRVSVTAWRDRGCPCDVVTIQMWTEYRDGSPVSPAPVRILRYHAWEAEIMADERYYYSACGRALRQAFTALRHERADILDGVRA